MCKRRHLGVFQESTITCTAATGIANAKIRAKALWQQLKGLLKAGKYAAVQVVVVVVLLLLLLVVVVVVVVVVGVGVRVGVAVAVTLTNAFTSGARAVGDGGESALAARPLLGMRAW